MFEKLKQWWGFDAASYRAPDGIPSPDEPRELVLFKSDMCGSCIRVMRVLDRTGAKVTFRDTGDPATRDILNQKTGRATVPCMFIDGVPLFESKDIANWLLAYDERAVTES